MTLNKMQPKWDIYEAVILLEGYLEYKENNISRANVIRRISFALRKMAVNRGRSIDDIYRNENGISYQLKSMESAVKGHTVYVPSTKLFDFTVSMYRDDYDKYMKLLEEARVMTNEIITTASVVTLEHENKAEILASNELFNSDLLSAAELIIPDVFPNGLRKSSPIARKKFNTAFCNLTGEALPNEVDLDKLALTVGIEYEDKIYVPSKKTKEFIIDEIHKVECAGCKIVFYDEFYNSHATRFSSDCIFSSELLKKVMKNVLPEMIFGKAYACFSEKDSLVRDIIHAFGEDVYLSYYEIKRRLPYADLYQIRIACSRNAEFVSMGDEVYALSDHICICEKDIENAKIKIAKDIEKNSFSMLNNINVDESESINHGINANALKTLLFDKYLSSDYNRRRSLITKPGIKIRMYDVMKNFCLEFDTISVEEIESYEREVSGRFTYGLNAAYDSMVRIDKNTFVHGDLISFDVDATDRAISLYVQDTIYPIADIPSFTSFPYIEGYTWNVFLLDSFCAHYSKKYRSLGGPAQKGIIGAIYPSNMQFDSYWDLLAQVAAKSELELTDGIVSDYLSRHKYLLRRSNINEVLAKAQAIRLKEE